jgi:hypothetical protein
MCISVHICTYMSVNGGGMGDDIDYSSFEYQHVLQSLTLDEGDDGGSANPRAVLVSDFEPLGKIGGLDVNEVAELVYYELQLAHEVEGEDPGGQTNSSHMETRGTFGINLPANKSGGTFVQDGNTPSSNDLVEVNNINEDNVQIGLRGNNDSQMLQQFMNYSTTGFDGSKGGGGGYTPNQTYHKNFRQLTGRGPVLDHNDDMTIAQLFVCSDTILQNVSQIRASMVWDVAETDDAGRRFSVPR